MPGVRGARILVFGDSLSAGDATPGGVFAQHMVANGAKVLFNAKIGRSAWNFYQRESVQPQLAAIRDFQPTLAVVILGTNDIGLSIAQDRLRMVQLRDELRGAGAQVWAFGPPAFPAGSREDNGAPAVAAMMRDVFGSRFLDLQPMTADMVTAAGGRAGDGIHFTGAGGAAAGGRMANAFMSAGDGAEWALPAALLLGLGWLLISR